MMNKNLSKVILASLLSGSLFGNALYANTALAADVTDQTKIVDSTENTDQIAGEATGTDNANNNTLIITGKGEINGSYDISNSISNGRAYGGKAENGDASGNKVIIEQGGKVTGSYVGNGVFGGYVADTGNANYNNIIINKGIVKTDVYGGYVEGSGNANHNIVAIIANDDDNKITGIYGGYAQTTGDTNYNIVTASGIETYLLYGGVSEQGDSSYNRVFLDQGAYINGNIYGGATNIGNTNYNMVTIVDNVQVDFYLCAGLTTTGNANHNIVNIYSSTVDDEVCGGKVSDAGNANDNTVTINAGKIDNNVYGGQVQNSGDAINNTVNIIGDVTFSTGSVLYGGDSGSGDAFTGNTLNVASAGLSLGNVANFENYNFYLTDANINADAVLNLQASSNTNLDKAKINATLSGAARALKVGDTVKLLHNSNGFSTTGTITGTTMQQGFSLIYGIELDTTSTDSVNFTVTEGGRATEASKSPSETRLATVGFLNSGIDNFTDNGITNAVAVASSDNGAVFAAAGGGQSRLHSGSYTNIKGYNFALGAAKAITNNAGKLTYGPFAEAGWGTYDSHLDCGVRGDGNTRYYGVGAFAHQDNNSGTYYEGSLRYGQTNSDYSGSGLTDGLGNPLAATYDSSSAYYGAHIGIGKVSKLTDTTSTDIYAKLLYTHQQGDSAVMAGSGETYDFDAVDSTRARVGARLSKTYSDRATAYVGTAYEYEFDGEATATVKGFSTLAPSIKGGSGMLELGYSLKPKAANDPTIDLSLQGWLGKKEGFTTNVNFMWKF